MLNVVERKKETAVGYTLLFVATATVKLQKMTAVLGCLTTSARLTSQLTIQISPSFGGMIGGQKRSNLSFFVQGHSLYVVLIQPGKFSSRVSTKNTSRGCNSIIIWIFFGKVCIIYFYICNKKCIHFTQHPLNSCGNVRCDEHSKYVMGVDEIRKIAINKSSSVAASCRSV